jgi:hypothetical protein
MWHAMFADWNSQFVSRFWSIHWWCTLWGQARARSQAWCDCSIW